MQLCSPIIIALERLRQENHKFEASLDYIARLSLKKKKHKRKRGRSNYKYKRAHMYLMTRVFSGRKLILGKPIWRTYMLSCFSAQVLTKIFSPSSSVPLWSLCTGKSPTLRPNKQTHLVDSMCYLPAPFLLSLSPYLQRHIPRNLQ
jgi:hypothetical protein